jgi:hypothetical protein
MAYAQTPSLTFPSSPVTFPPQLRGTTGAQYLYVTNNSAQAVSFSSITVTGPNAGDFWVYFTSCTSGLTVNSSCYLDLQFMPSTIGAESAQLNFADNAAGSPQTVALVGTGQGPILSLLTYPAVGFLPQNLGTTSYAQGLYIESTGNSAVSISSLAISGTNAADFHIAANECIAPIEPYLPCFVYLTFSPGAAGARSAVLTITDNASGSPQTVALSGTGQTPVAALSFYSTALNFGVQNLNSSATLNVNITNTGNSPVSFGPLALSGPNAGDFRVFTDDCPSPLSPSSFCQIYVTFTPTAVGARSAILSISDTAAGSPQSIALSGTGQATSTALSISPNPITFQPQDLSSTSSQPVSIENPGNPPLTISSIAIAGQDAGDFSLAFATPCNAPVSLYESCNFLIVFHPQAPGLRSAVLTITDTATGSPQIIPVSGTGVVAPVLTFAPAAVNFGTVGLGTTGIQTLTITNNNSQPVAFTSAVLDGTDPQDFLITGNTCPISGALGARANCSITISFSPSLPGARSANLAITDGAAQSPQVIFLGGNGATETRTLAFQPLALSFGNEPVGTQSTALTLTVTNTGNAPLTFSSIQMTGADAADFSVTENDCLNSAGPFQPPAVANLLAEGISCSIYVSFNPRAPGSRQAALTFSGDQTHSPQSIPVLGNGIQPGAALAADPLEINYGVQPVGTSTYSQSVNLQNAGTTPLNLSPMAITGVNAGDFTISGNACPGQLSNDQSCSVSIAFTPSATGTRNAQLTIGSSAANSPQTVPLTGVGLGGSNTLTVNAPGIFFGGQPVVGAIGAESIIELQNTGIPNINLQSFTITGANAGDFVVTYNDCADNGFVAPYQACGVGVTFKPSATGLRVASLNIVNDAGNSPLVVPINGVGLSARGNPFSVFPTTLHFSQPVGATSATGSVTLVNTGSQPVSVFTNLTGSSDFEYLGMGCPTFSNTLAPGESCTLGVQYTPHAVGSSTATLGITSGAGTAAVSLDGSGQNPSVTLSFPSTVTFNAQGLKITSLPQAVTLRNSGTLPVTLSHFTIGGTNAADFAINANACPASLESGLSCTLGVTFSPSAAGTRRASLVITDNAGNSPQSVELSGTGETSQLTLNFSKLLSAFGPVNLGASATSEIVISNPGSSSVSVSAYSISGTNASDFSISANTCASTDANQIPGGGQCSITVAFKPALAGLRTAALTVTDNASGSPQTVSLNGSGQTVIDGIALTPATLDFAGVEMGAENVQTLTATNTGDVPLTLGTFSIAGGNASDFTIAGSCSTATLAPGASCTVKVTFAPGAVGLRASTLSMTATAALAAQSVALSGFGLAYGPAVSVVPTTYDFGVSDIGAAVSSTALTIANTGVSNVIFTSYAVSGTNAGDFTITGNTCASAHPNVLPPGIASSCALTVTFKPSASGIRHATLSLTDNAAGGGQTIALTGMGQASSKLLTMIPLAYDFGVSPVGTPVNYTFGARSIGSASATISKVALAGTNASDFAITTNGCATPTNVLPVSFSCSVTVTFTPSTAGPRTASLQFYDDASGSPQSIPLAGEGQALQRSLQISPTPLLLTSAIGTAVTRYLYFTNTGATLVTFTNATISGTNAADFAIGFNNCQQGYYLGLPTAGNCSIAITFTPSVAGSETATLNVTDNSSASPQTISLMGMGQSAQKTLSFTAADLLFPATIGDSAEESLSWTPVGTAPVTVSGLTFSGPNASEFSVDSSSLGCVGQPLAPGSYCGGYFQFTPRAEALSTATLQITDDVTGSTQSVPLEGSGAAAGGLGLEPGSLNFGPVAVTSTSAQNQVLFFNYSSAAITPGTPTLTGNNAGDFSIVSSNCSGALLTSDYFCAVTVAFTPSAVGVRLAAVKLPYSGGSGTVAYGLLGGEGTGGTGIAAVNSLALEFDPADINTNSSQAASIQVTNTGLGLIHFSPATFTGSNAADFFVVPDSQNYMACTATLLPGASCQLVFGFAPGGAGLRSATLELNGDAPNMPVRVSLTGVGQAPNEVLYSSSKSMDFGAQSIAGLSGGATLSLLAGGIDNIGLTTIEIAGTNASDFSFTTNCGSVLIPGSYNLSSCSINITFAPPAAGLRTAALIITSDAPGSPLTIPLSGVGLPASNSLSLSEVNADFGFVNIGAQTTSLIFMSNFGGLPVNFSLPTFSGPDAADFSIASDACATLPPASSNFSGCTIKVAFSPSAVGQRTATLQIVDNAVGSPQTVALFGTGQIVSRLLTASASTLDFGAQSQGIPSSTSALEIYNTGASPVVISGIAFSGASAADFFLDPLAQGTCGGTVAAGTSCIVYLQFLPTSIGRETAVMTVKSNSAGGPVIVSLLGQGQKAITRLSASNFNLDFGAQTAGTVSSAQSISVLNTGNTAVSLFPPSIVGSNGFNFAATPGTCTGTLAVGQACSVSVVFAPSVAGVVSAELQINSTAAAPVTVSLTGTGK